MLAQLLLTKFSKYANCFHVYRKLITWFTIESGLFWKSKNLGPVFPKSVLNWCCLLPSFTVLNNWTLLSVTFPKYVRCWCEGMILIQAKIQQFIWSANGLVIKFILIHQYSPYQAVTGKIYYLPLKKYTTCYLIQFLHATRKWMNLWRSTTST